MKAKRRLSNITVSLVTGTTVNRNASRYPNLAGQNAPYLVSRLKYFRAEEEPGNQMNAQAVLLTDEEINLLADYFSKQAN